MEQVTGNPRRRPPALVPRVLGRGPGPWGGHQAALGFFPYIADTSPSAPTRRGFGNSQCLRCPVPPSPRRCQRIEGAPCASCRIARGSRTSARLPTPFGCIGRRPRPAAAPARFSSCGMRCFAVRLDGRLEASRGRATSTRRSRAHASLSQKVTSPGLEPRSPASEAASLTTRTQRRWFS